MTKKAPAVQATGSQPVISGYADKLKGLHSSKYHEEAMRAASKKRQFTELAYDFGKNVSDEQVLGVSMLI